MLMRKRLTTMASALAVALFLTQAPAAMAQLVPAGQADGQYNPAQDPDNQSRDGNVERSSGRISRPNRRAATRAPSPEENMAAAQAAATGAGLSCQVTEATLLGQTAERNSLYEAACATGPGYLITASTPPQAVDCVVAAASAAQQAAAQPAGPAALSCKLAANLDTTAVLAGYAREAGITCQVDAGGPIGTSEGKTVYEIGCAGVDGYRLQQTDTGWEKTECWVVVSAGATCSRTTPEEQHTSLKARLVGTDAASCVVDGGRYMGGNANGVFYEAKCSGAEGYVIRVKDDATQQVYPCAIAQPIGGGCTLTPIEVSNAAAEAAAATPQ